MSEIVSIPADALVARGHLVGIDRAAVPGDTDLGAWTTALAAPQYTVRVRRSVADVEVEQAFYVDFPTDTTVRVDVLEDTVELERLVSAEFLFDGIADHLDLAPGSHPDPEDDASAPATPEQAPGALLVSVNVLVEENGAVALAELDWVDLGDQGLWIEQEDGTWYPYSDADVIAAVAELFWNEADRLVAS